MRAGLLERARKTALDFFLPLTCVGCRKEGRGICEECLAAVPKIQACCQMCAQPGEPILCRRCMASPLPISGIRAAYPFEGPIRAAVHAFKYRNYRALAPELAAIMARRLDDDHTPATLLVPVPMHPRRVRSRGYNQAELLARELAKLTGIPVAKDALKRLVDTPPQVQRGARAARMEIAEGTFSATRGLDEEAVLLVDDVVTTASTMSACATALWQASPDSVYGLALARES